MYDLIAISIPIVLTIATVSIARIISQAGVSKRLTETQTDPEVIRVILENERTQRQRSAVTWAAMLSSIGLAIMLIGIFRLESNDPLAYGMLFLAAGAGMAISVLPGRR